MAFQYLFDSSGDWVAFKVDKNLFNPDGDWIGWLPWNNNMVISPSGDYVGTIYHDNRLYHFENSPYMGYPGYPAYAGYPGYPGYPGYAGYSPLPVGASDVNLSKGKE